MIYFEIGKIEKWVNQNTKGDQLASFLFHHFSLCPIESTLEHGLQQLSFVVEYIII